MSNNVDMARLKEVEINIFKEFLKICEKYRLRYFLLGGTCLGAVRHGGFIPWDDDIDVGMPRKDYEEFLKIAQKELPDGYFLQHGASDKEYSLNFAKIRDSRTTFKETTVKDFKINHGVYIDIFPLDGYKKRFVRDTLNKIYTFRISREYYVPQRAKGGIKGMLTKIVNILFKDYRKVRDKRDALLKKDDFDSCETVHNFCGAWAEREIVPKAVFGEGTKGTFEGLEVNLPENYHMYLRSLYGNYMEFPPEEKRVAHHFCEVIDLEKSYKEYM